MKTNRLFVLLTLAILITTSFSASVADPATDRKANIIRDLGSNSLHLITRPSSAAIVFSLGAVPLIADDETNKAYRHWGEKGTVNFVFEAGEVIGSGSLQGAASLALYASGKALRRDGLAAYGSDLFSAQAISSFVAATLKVATARTRPDGAPYSFPSGHSTVSFATAGVIWKRSGFIPGSIAELLASYIAVSRLQENKHYITDLIGGCVLGNYVAFLVTRDSHGDKDIVLSPSFSNNNLGLLLSKRF